MCLKPLIHTKIFKRISSHLLDFGFWIAFTNFFRNFFFKNFHFPKKLSHKNAIKTDWLFWLFFLAKLAIFHLRQLATLSQDITELRSFIGMNHEIDATAIFHWCLSCVSLRHLSKRLEIYGIYFYRIEWHMHQKIRTTRQPCKIFRQINPPFFDHVNCTVWKSTLKNDHAEKFSVKLHTKNLLILLLQMHYAPEIFFLWS